MCVSGDINFCVCVCVCAAEQPFLCGLPSALDFINTLFCLARSQRRLKCTERIGRLFHGRLWGEGGSWGGVVRRGLGVGVCGHAADHSHLLLDQEAVNYLSLPVSA